MIVRILALVLVLGFGSRGHAAPDTALPAACLIERPGPALIACVEHEAALIEQRSADRLRRFAATAQAASGAEIAAFERALATARRQRDAKTRERCQDADRTAEAICRLSEARAFAAQAEAELAEAQAQLGATPYGGYVPRLEIRPLPRGGFIVDVIIDQAAPN
ncbi:MAG: hypothetical protein AAGC57_16395 [Pseudomonadota bacterium]